MIHAIRISRQKFADRSRTLQSYVKSSNLSGEVLGAGTNALFFNGFSSLPTEERPIASALSAGGERTMFVPRPEVEHAKAEANLDRLDYDLKYHGHPQTLNSQLGYGAQS